MICCMMMRIQNPEFNDDFIAGASCFMASLIWYHCIIMLFMFKHGYMLLYIGGVFSILQIVMPRTIPPLTQPQQPV